MTMTDRRKFLVGAAALMVSACVPFSRRERSVPWDDLYTFQYDVEVGVPDGEWHHYVMTRSGDGEVRICIDGIPAETSEDERRMLETLSWHA